MSLTSTIRPGGQTAGVSPGGNRAGSNDGLVTESPTGKFTTRLLGFYIFLLVSRVLDLSPIWWMHIPLILLAVLILLTLARGGVKLALASNISRYFGLFTLWVIVSYPFSLWRSASQPWVIGSFEFFLVFLIIVQVVRTAEDWRTVAGGYAYGVLVAAIYGFIFARSVDGRLALVGGTFGDPNGFALSLLIGVPFLWLKAAYSNVLRKVFFWACSGVVFISFAKAGSRAGLLALGTMMLMMFLISNGRQRLLICVAGCLGIVAAAAFLPGYLKARYLTIFSPASSSAELDTWSREQLESDIESSGERRALLEQSIQMSFEHPIFGVGPGVFAFAAWDERKSQTGAGGLTLVTHNTYTQISSETGLPGFVFFMGAIFFCLKYALFDYRAMTRAGRDVAKLSRYLLMSFSALLVGIFFLSTAYSHFLAIFVALAASLHNVVMRESNLLASVPGSATAMSPRISTVPQAPKPTLAASARKRIPSYLRRRGIAKPSTENPANKL